MLRAELAADIVVTAKMSCECAPGRIEPAELEGRML
jgi:hypothetical protein